MKYETYRLWEAAVNELMVDVHGIGIDDIPDMDWNSWYLEGWTPKQAADKAIKEVNTGLLW